MIAHIAKRITLIVAGYLAALAASCIPVWALAMTYGPTAFYVPKEPLYLPPELASLIIVLLIALFFSFVPALIVILAAEIWRWRGMGVYLLGALFILALITFPVWTRIVESGIALVDWAAWPTAILSTLLGGFTYWLVAGRKAGSIARSVTS